MDMKLEKKQQKHGSAHKRSVMEYIKFEVSATPHYYSRAESSKNTQHTGAESSRAALIT